MATSNKRKRDDEQEVEKKVVQEGMSWWNCLMLDMSYENTRPQAVPVARGPQPVPVARGPQQSSLGNHQQQLRPEQLAKAMDEADIEDCNCEDCLSQKPSEPLPSDCCGSGCEPCVNDLYDADLKAWRRACLKRHEGSQTNKDCHAVIETGSYSSFQIEWIKTESPDTYTYRFTIPNKRSLNLDVGQHLVLRAQVDGRWTTRQYTPVSPLKAQGYFDMLIKLYKDGPMSIYINDLITGDMVEWRGPYGRYQYQQNQYSHIVMVAAGTGIAPMLQVIRHIVSNEEEDTFVRLIYACKTYSDILMRQQLNQLTDFWNFTVLYVLSQEDQADCPSTYGEHLHFGRLDESLVSREMPPNNDKSQILICGTKSFDKDMIKYFRKLNFEGDIFKF